MSATAPQPRKRRSKRLLPDELVFMAQIPIALVFGNTQAMLLQHLDHLLQTPLARFHDGKWWIALTAKQWPAKFPLASEQTISRAWLMFEDAGIVLSGCHSDDKSDRTKWITIDYDGLQSWLDTQPVADPSDKNCHMRKLKGISAPDPEVPLQTSAAVTHEQAPTHLTKIVECLNSSEEEKEEKTQDLYKDVEVEEKEGSQGAIQIPAIRPMLKLVSTQRPPDATTTPEPDPTIAPANDYEAPVVSQEVKSPAEQAWHEKQARCPHPSDMRGETILEGKIRCTHCYAWIPVVEEDPRL